MMRQPGVGVNAGDRLAADLKCQYSQAALQSSKKWTDQSVSVTRRPRARY
jgi:hypothetical protein